MITPAEKRFIRSWEEQRQGGKGSYCLLYTFGGGFIIAIVTYILLLWILQIRVPRPLWLVPSISFVLGAIVSVIAWNMNEGKFKRIIRREIKAGGE